MHTYPNHSLITTHPSPNPFHCIVHFRRPDRAPFYTKTGLLQTHLYIGSTRLYIREITWQHTEEENPRDSRPEWTNWQTGIGWCRRAVQAQPPSGTHSTFMAKSFPGNGPRKRFLEFSTGGAEHGPRRLLNGGNIIAFVDLGSSRILGVFCCVLATILNI